METINAVENSAHRRSGILYPVMVIAAITLIVFSVVGIATMMGWMPSATSGGEHGVKSGAARPGLFASASASCANCGVVESIRVVETAGQGTGVGAIGGAVVGGILGNQVGRGSGRTAATVVGAGAGAYAGNEIEKNAKKSAHFQVRVRMNDGSYRTFRENAQPALSVGQKVRVTEQGVVAAG